jgi:heme-degrading monooxygenase HmoA
MIARIWHGVTAAAKANECVEYLKVSELSDYAKTDGNRGVYLLRRVAGNEAHFLTLTFWDSEQYFNNSAQRTSKESAITRKTQSFF